MGSAPCSTRPCPSPGIPTWLLPQFSCPWGHPAPTPCLAAGLGPAPLPRAPDCAPCRGAEPTHTAPHHRLQAQQQVAQVAHALLVVLAAPDGAGQDLLHVEPHHLQHRLAAEVPLG